MSIFSNAVNWTKNLIDRNKKELIGGAVTLVAGPAAGAATYAKLRQGSGSSSSSSSDSTAAAASSDAPVVNAPVTQVIPDRPADARMPGTRGGPNMKTLALWGGGALVLVLLLVLAFRRPQS